MTTLLETLVSYAYKIFDDDNKEQRVKDELITLRAQAAKADALQAEMDAINAELPVLRLAWRVLDNRRIGVSEANAKQFSAARSCFELADSLEEQWRKAYEASQREGQDQQLTDCEKLETPSPEPVYYSSPHTCKRSNGNCEYNGRCMYENDCHSLKLVEPEYPSEQEMEQSEVDFCTASYELTDEAKASMSGTVIRNEPADPNPPLRFEAEVRNTLTVLTCWQQEASRQILELAEKVYAHDPRNGGHGL